MLSARTAPHVYWLVKVLLYTAQLWWNAIQHFTCDLNLKPGKLQCLIQKHFISSAKIQVLKWYTINGMKGGDRSTISKKDAAIRPTFTLCCAVTMWLFLSSCSALVMVGLAKVAWDGWGSTGGWVMSTRSSGPVSAVANGWGIWGRYLFWSLSNIALRCGAQANLQNTYNLTLFLKHVSFYSHTRKLTVKSFQDLYKNQNDQ